MLVEIEKKMRKAEEALKKIHYSQEQTAGCIELLGGLSDNNFQSHL